MDTIDPNQNMFSADAEQDQEPDFPEITWASDVESAQQPMRQTGWFVSMGVAAVLLSGLVYFLSRDILSTLVTLFAVGALMFVVLKPSARVTYALEEDGIVVAGKHYLYDSFRSFSIIEAGEHDILWLTPIQRFLPSLVVHFPPELGEDIVSILSSVLPHEDKAMDFVDRLSRRLKW
jgi:hypothetical protein